VEQPRQQGDVRGDDQRERAQFEREPPARPER
jgi:hypothetical protein